MGIRSISAEPANINLHPNAQESGKNIVGSIRLVPCAERPFCITITNTIPTTAAAIRSAIIPFSSGNRPLRSFPTVIRPTIFRSSLFFHGARHIRVQSFKDDVSNNLIECFNKQFKAWYKTKQGFSSFESANNLISMFVFFFNFVRPHSALNGLTPARVAGLSLPTRKKRDFPLVAWHFPVFCPSLFHFYFTLPI